MMKHTYSFATSWLRWLCLCLLLALPGLGMAQTVTLTSNTPDPQNFGSVPVGTTSASKAYTVSGTGLVNDITVSIPNQFEGSTDNIAFSTTTITVAQSGGTVPNTAIYLRFKPTATGSITRGFIASTYDATFTPVNSAPTIVLTGTGAVGTPTITVNPNALTGFGNQAINTASAPKSVSVTGTSLTANITVQAPTGFLVSSDGTTYATTATLVQTNGSVNATLYVEFKPTAAGPANGDVTLASTNALSQTVSVSGTGVAPTPVLNVNPAALPDFGSVVVGTTGTTTGTFTVDGQSLQGNVTITPPAGFRIRTGTNLFSTNPVVLTPTNGTLTSTSIDVRFSPTAAQAYADVVSATTLNGGATITQNVNVSGTGTAAAGGASLNASPGALSFGAVTSSGSATTLSFDVSGTNLTADMVLTPSASTIQIRNASAGGTFSNSPLTLTPTSGTVATQTIEVRLVPTVPKGSYNERVDVTSTGAPATLVSLTATNNSGSVSDISVSTSGTDYTFVTRPNTISASKSYLLAGTNLLQPLVVAPTGPSAAYFQVSTDNVTFVSQLSFTPDAQGNVTQRPIYVRFTPGAAALTVSANISNTSSPAPATDVSVTGISEPTIRLNQPIGNFPFNQVKGTQSDPSFVRLDGFLLGGNLDVQFPADAADATRNPTQTPQYEFSFDNGTTYVKTATFVPDANGNLTQNLLVRFAPVRVGNANQEMQFRSPGFSNGAYFPLTSGYGRVSGFAIAPEPTAQSTAFVNRAADGKSATIIFYLNTPPAGTSYGQDRLVIATPSYQKLPTGLSPLDKQNFNPGTTDANGAYQFGTGSPIETSSNTYVVFSGSSGSFTVSGLDPTLYYQFFGFEFNNDQLAGAENYRVPSNQPQVPLPVELLAFTAQRHGKQVDLNWATASEKNSRSFDVERSADGQQFKAILSKAGQGTTSSRTNYAATDHQPLPGLSYYRLKQIDLDGTAAYSPVVSVQSDGAVEIGIYPNPTAGKLTISLPEALAASAPRVRISDLMGRVVKELSLPATGEVDLSALPAGTYLVNVGGQQVRSRVVKY